MNGSVSISRIRLEQPDEMQPSIPFAGFITDEANAALSVKAGRTAPRHPRQSAVSARDSANPSRVGRELTFIGRLTEDYKQVDGEPLGERNTKVLQSDYVKFIRWAQWRIDKNGEGVIGYIVNNSFLDGPTFRGMRQSLFDSFNTIYLLNLHGSNRVTEVVPEAENDENVFDILQGVSILLCVKERDNSASAKVYYAGMWGFREEKYRVLSDTDVQSTEWAELQPTSPYYLFVPQTTELRAEYDQGWEITDIFQMDSVGIVTGRDKFTLHWTVEKLCETVTDFISLSEDEAPREISITEG